MHADSPQTDRSGLFPGTVRLWHFILIPTVGMAVVLLLSRLGERLLPADLDPLTQDLYSVARMVLIAVVMASLVAWLALAYRRQYETRLAARNETLEKTREFLTRIIEGSAEAIITLDPALRISSWNRAAAQIYGWSAQEMVGESLDRLLPPGEETQRKKERVDAEVRQGQTLRDFETVHIRRDGARIRVRMTVSPFYSEGQQYEGAIAIVRDVTSLVELENRLREQDRLAAVGRLAAQVAHEIKNPLAGLRGACEVMMTRLERDSGKEIAEEMVRQIDRLNRTVEDLLLFSRRSSTRPVPSDLHAVIDSVIGVVLGAADARRLEVVRDFSPDLGQLTVDPEQMQQVLFNIILNAAQVMDYDGKLIVRTRVDNQHVAVVVQDTGPGISADHSESIFEPFYTTRAQGTGLGLAIVKKIIHAHDGTIEARNLPERGAEFEIRLPNR